MGSGTTQTTNPVNSTSVDIDGMYIAAVNKASNVTFASVSSGFTLRTSSQATAGTALSTIMLDLRVSAAANGVNPSVTISGSTAYIGSGTIVVFKAAAGKYWIGNGSNTDCTAASNWATQTGGSTANAAPTSSDNVYFNSGGTGSCTMSSAQSWSSVSVNSGYTGTITIGANLTLTSSTQVSWIAGGTVAAGAATVSLGGGLHIWGTGKLGLTSTGTIAVGSGKGFIVDGTLEATDSSTVPTIQVNSSGTYAFTVGSNSAATPTLNIDGLNVQNTDANGLQVNANTSASTTFTTFNKIAFSSGTSGGTLLNIYAPSLNLISNGCSFDASTKYTVTLTGDGFTVGSESTQTRALFGGATCTAGSCQSTKSDDDSGNDGVPTTGSGGAVVQFVANAPTDTAGTIQGFPTAAFSWNDGTYYSTYVAFNNTSSGSATVYVRDSTGAAKYSWSPGTATIVGTPRWTTEGSSGSEKHYLYVALSSGKVYRLLDSGSSLAADTTTTGWSSANPYDCACTITTPLAIDTTNLYWAGQKTSDSTYRIWAIGQSNQSVPGWSPMRPSAVSSPTTSETAVTPASVALRTSGSTYAFLGQTGYIVKANVSNGTIAEYNSNPGTGKSVLGRIYVVTSGTNRVLAGDDGGNFWSIDPANFSGTNLQWNYNALAGTDQIKSSPIYEYTTGYVHFGTEGGRLVVLNGSTGAALTGYPMTSLSTDPMRTAVLYRSGVIAVGTTTGRLFFVNRRTTSGGTPVLMREYYFGSTQQVSGIAYDCSAQKYLVSTSSSSANDGRLYTIDATDSVLTDSDGIL